MQAVQANLLKTKGIAAIEEAFKDQPEAVLLVHGQANYVIVTQDHHRYLKECEIQAARAATHSDIRNGRFVKETVADHIKRVKQL